MESRGKIVIINADEPLDNLESALVRHTTAMLDILFMNHDRMDTAVFSKGLIEISRIVLSSIKTKE